jgi:hypothetical protein
MKMVWLELRPYAGGEFKPVDEFTRNILASLYSFTIPYKFLVVYDDFEGGEGRRIRFFIQVREGVDRTLKESFMLKKVLVEQRDPPKRVYSHHTRIRMQSYYAYPIYPLMSELKENPVDTIVSSMIGREYCAYEVTAVGSRIARANILRRMEKKAYKRTKYTTLTGRVRKGEEGPVYTPMERHMLDAMREKASQETCLCDVAVRGMSGDDVRSIAQTFPRSGLNNLVPSLVRREENVVGPAKKPGMTWVRKYLAHFLAFAASALMVYVMTSLNLLFSLEMFSFVACVSAASTPFMFSAFYDRKVLKNDVCLNAKELSMIVNLPSRVSELPLNFAPFPVGRIEVPSVGKEEVQLPSTAGDSGLEKEGEAVNG